MDMKLQKQAPPLSFDQSATENLLMGNGFSFSLIPYFAVHYHHFLFESTLFRSIVVIDVDVCTKGKMIFLRL